jgi:hypothetical protein
MSRYQEEQGHLLIRTGLSLDVSRAKGTNKTSLILCSLDYGDDYLPEHMRHVQDNQKEFPQNKGAFDVNPDAKEDRIDKVGGSNVRPGPDPVTGVGRVKDEKPLASQQLGPGNPGTTWQPVSHEESGGAGKGTGQLKLEEDAQKDWEKKNPGKTYQPPLPKVKPELPEGSQRSTFSVYQTMDLH